MNQYMSDSSFTDLDPRELILDPYMQARDPELINNNKDRDAQLRKQLTQDNDILEELLNGGEIRQPITVFQVDTRLYVVDGFHRTKACLKYLQNRPEESIMVKAKLITNRTYEEAFIAAQNMNQDHGVGVSKDEARQATFRALIVQREFVYSVSKLKGILLCSQGHAHNTQRALKACEEVLSDIRTDISIDIAHLTELLKERLTDKYGLTAAAWDNKQFPKVSVLAKAYSGKEVTFNDDEEKLKHLIACSTEDITKLIRNYGEGVFREALRKAVRGTGLGISVTKKTTWEEEHGFTDDSQHLQDYEELEKSSLENYGF